jgi:hypothetical protein
MTPQQAAGYQTQILLPMLTPQGAGNLTLEKIKIMGGANRSAGEIIALELSP